MGCKCTFKGLIRFVAMRALEGLIVILVLMFMPNMPPNCKFEKSYKMTPTLPLEGKLSLNEKLSTAELWHHGDFHGAEAFAVYNNEIYTSLGNGYIVKLTGNKHITPVIQFGVPCKPFEEKLCGRPLGLMFDKNGILYATDAYYGIYKVNIKTGEKEQLVSPLIEINERKPKIFNSIAVSSSGDVYWTDSSTEFDLQNGLYDLLADGSGRLVHYDPKTKRNKVLIDYLHLANGVVLSKNEDFLLVSETGRSRIHRYYLKGSKSGSHEVFIDGLPGVPDNITPDGHGGFLVPLVLAQDSEHPNPAQIFGPFPRMRKVIARVMGLFDFVFGLIDRIYPNDYAKMGMHFVGNFQSTSLFLNGTRVTVLHVSDQGVILDSIHTTDGKLFSISEATIYNNLLLLGSPYNDYIARIPLSDIGWTHLTPTTKHVPQQAKVPPPTPAAAKKEEQTKPTQVPKKENVIENQAGAPTKAPTPKKDAPPPKKETPPPPKKEIPPPPKKETPPPPKKETPPPPKKETPPPPKKETPPQTKQQTPPPAAKPQTPPPAAKPQTPPPAAKPQTPPPAAKQQTPSPTKQTPPPPQSKQAPPPPQSKQAPPPAQAKQGPPPAQSKQATPPPAAKSPPPPTPTNPPAPKPKTPAPAKESTKSPPSQTKPASDATNK